MKYIKVTTESKYIKFKEGQNSLMCPGTEEEMRTAKAIKKRKLLFAWGIFTTIMIVALIIYMAIDMEDFSQPVLKIIAYGWWSFVLYLSFSSIKSDMNRIKEESYILCRKVVYRLNCQNKEDMRQNIQALSNYIKKEEEVRKSEESKRS